MAREKTDTKSLSEVGRFLLVANSLQAYDPGNEIDLYRAFDLTGCAHKGQLTSGYGERGTKVSLDVSWDFGDLILPGLVSAKVEGGMSAQKTRYALILVMRHPTKILGLFTQRAQWETVHPLCLAILKGYAAEMKAHLGASMSIGYITGVDELGLKVGVADEEEEADEDEEETGEEEDEDEEDKEGLKASAAAKLDLGGRVLRLRDAWPRFYPPSPSDHSLAVDFVKSIDVLTRHQIKNLIQAWLKERLEETDPKNWERVKKFLEKQTEDQKEDLEERKEEAISWAKEQTRLDKLQEKWKSLGIKVEQPNLFKRIVRALRPPKTADLLKNLEKLDKQLPGEDEGEDEDEKRKTKELRNQIRYWRHQLEALQKRKAAALVETPKSSTKLKQSPKRKQLDYLSRICYLNLLSVGGGGSAEAGAKANLKLTNPLKKSHEISGKVDAKASIAGRANLISFRLQTLASGTGKLVTTQDTVLTYREVDKEAYATGSLDLDLPEGYTKEEDGQFEGKKEKKRCYRTLTYQSAVTYWIYPRTSTGSPLQVKPRLGSGVCFGFGVQVSRLIALAKALVAGKKLEAKSTRLLDRISSQLHVPSTDVKRFLVAANIHEDDPKQFITEVLLLESGFALPQLVSRSKKGKAGRQQGKNVKTPPGPADRGSNVSFMVEVKKKKTDAAYELPDMLKDERIHRLTKKLEKVAGTPQATAGEGGLHLDCMRLRYRLGDSHNRTETMVKLGFSYVVGFDFHVERVKTAGHEGIIDLFAWFAKPELNDEPLEGHERSVPPVAMLHH